MQFAEVWNKLKESSYFGLVIILVVAIIILLIVRSNKKKNLENRINECSKIINGLKSHHFSVDIAKLDALARINKSIKETAESCKVSFDTIQQNMNNATSLLTDATECIQINNFKECENKLNEIEPLLKSTEETTSKLDEVLAGILNQASLQRKRINEIKGDFHEVKNFINQNAKELTYCWESLDGITRSISHQFSEFEAIMDASKFDAAAEKSEEIKASIDELHDLVQELPELINFAKTNVPNAISELNANYQVALSNGVFLDHLEIPHGIATINADVNVCLNNLKACSINGIKDKLSSCISRVNKMNNQLADEKATFKDMIAVRDEIGNSLNSIENIIKNVNENQADLFERYDLSALKNSFEEVCSGLEGMSEYASLCEAVDSKTIPATTLIISFDELKADVDELLKKAQSITSKLATSRVEEKRVRDLVSRFTVVLNESKASIKLSRLPSISKKYDDDIHTAELYINELNEKLIKESMDITNVTETVNKAQKVVLNLFKNVTNLIDTTNDLENYIILCNKYRPFYPDLDSALCSAELAYRNGEYTKACTLTANALEKIDPELAKELSEKINKKLAGQKEE